jgi:Recombinase
MASGSYSLAAIVEILNQEGFRGRKGHRVGKSAFEKILKNPIYYSLVKASDVSILPIYRKPFDMIAEGLSRLNWLPFVNEYRTLL